MLVQATSPRPIFDHSKHPEYVYIHTLAKVGVSDGAVFFTATENPTDGARGGRQLEPVGEYPIEGETGFQAYEYVLPFFELFREEYKKKNLYLVPFCTAGFGVTIRSAFRGDTTTYVGRTMAFTILAPVTGGGILRLADSPYDLANPTFDPWAANPFGQKLLGSSRDPDLLNAFNRTHKLGSSAIDARRAARIAAAGSVPALESASPPRLPAPGSDGNDRD